MRDKILDTADSLVRERGFNAFSYADIAADVGIKTASIHYHFPTKSNLGEALVERYRFRFSRDLDRIDEENDAPVRKIAAYLDLFLESIDENRICPALTLATDMPTLPEPVREAVRQFIIDNETWLTRIFRDGRNDRTLEIDGNVEMIAKQLFSSVAGALILARALDSEERYITTANALLRTIAPRN